MIRSRSSSVNEARKLQGVFSAFGHEAFRLEWLEYIQHVANVDVHDLDIHSGADRSMFQGVWVCRANAVLVINR